MYMIGTPLFVMCLPKYVVTVIAGDFVDQTKDNSKYLFHDIDTKIERLKADYPPKRKLSVYIKQR